MPFHHQPSSSSTDAPTQPAASTPNEQRTRPPTLLDEAIDEDGEEVVEGEEELDCIEEQKEESGVGHGICDLDGRFLVGV